MATIGQHIKNIFGRRRASSPDEFDRAAMFRAIQEKGAPYIWPDYETSRAQWHVTDIEGFYEQGFNANALVYSAIMYKAQSYGAVPLRAYKGDPDNPEPLPVDHPLSKVCMRPNMSQSFQEFQTLQTIYVNLAGDCYGYLDRQGSERGAPAAIYPLDPRRVYIIPKNQRALGYVYIPEGKGPQSGEAMLPQDVMHVKFPRPGDRLEGQGYGLSPLSAASYSIDVDNAVSKFLQIFFQKGAVIPGLLTFDAKLTNDEVNRVRERWLEIYGGHEQWYKPAVLDNQGKYQRVALSFDEMGFEAIDNRDAAMILSALHVSPILVGAQLGLQYSTYSNYAEARQAFWEDWGMAELLMFENDYQYYLQSDDGGFVAFDKSKIIALAGQRKDAAAMFAQLVAAGIPKNDAARMADLAIPDLPDGNTIYMPMSLVPVGQVGQQPAVPQPQPRQQPNADGMAEAEEEAEEEDRQTRALEALALELKAAREALERENDVSQDTHPEAADSA
ncbi:MAG: phage portal protein [Gammaproteobacteria bacterium]|nr:phage portal protein [Gammaproteobacteria bacterium]